MKKEYDNELCIVIDDKQVEKYKEVYFSKYPRRKKFPIDSPIPPSFNKFILWKRPQQNATKQRWKEFIEFVAYDYYGMMIEDCELEFIFTFGDKRRRDIDNYISVSAKLIQDGLTDEEGIGMIVDDSYFHIHKLSASARYEKGIKRVEIICRYNNLI